MLDAFLYVFTQALERVYAFLFHWYADSFFFISRNLIALLKAIDKRVEARASLGNIFNSKGKNFNIVRSILDFFKAILAFSLYLLISLSAAVLYLLWASILIAILAWGFAL